VLDLCERQAKPSCLTDEREQLQNIVWIPPVTRFRAMGGRQNSPRLVEPQCLATDTATLRHFADQ